MIWTSGHGDQGFYLAAIRTSHPLSGQIPGHKPGQPAIRTHPSLSKERDVQIRTTIRISAKENS